MLVNEEATADAVDEVESIGQDLLQRLEILGAGDLRGEISAAQYRMLTVVQKRGPLSLGKVARILGTAQSTTSEMAARAMKAGLVVKARGPYDGRVVVVELTDAGRQLLRRGRKRIREAYRALYDGLPPGDRDLLLGSLAQLDGLLRKSDA